MEGDGGMSGGVVVFAPRINVKGLVVFAGHGGDACKPAGPFGVVAVFGVAIVIDFCLGGGYACGDGCVIGRAGGTCVFKIPAGDGACAFVTGLPCAVAELVDVRDGHVVHGVRAETVEHDEQGFRFLLCISHVPAECKNDNAACGQTDDV